MSFFLPLLLGCECSKVRLLSIGHYPATALLGNRLYAALPTWVAACLCT